MAEKHIGKQTVALKNPPTIKATASIVGPKEGRGELKQCFDLIIPDELWGESSWEKAESKLVREAFAKLLQNAKLSNDKIDFILAGDLLNQCIAASYGLRETNVPFLGLYGACSTMAESMSIGSMLIDGGFADNVVCLTSSHFCSAERQFRFPLELGSQRTPTAQWTVTGSGAVALASQGTGPYIRNITVGKINDLGITDINNMGAAMAPAAADTILTHFADTGLVPEYYDLIVTGDLGKIGKKLCLDILRMNGLNIEANYNDCGVMIFNLNEQDTHAGGSGCGCSAAVFAGHIYKEMMKGNLKRVLFIATGALMSPVSLQQKESIPGIAHAVSIHRSLD
ncbi:stage V sporulation protein AD [Ruminiclostridium sufflavum DSM 19573]|uniref:Stage V sporulation protein AD n=1 Tax=Ruminiclostridium sufflavum DSM 19573 TaxID=1121337 RepID=A0A318XLB3_9FIRM|nr:stage V sporulation protein AD [Ruminiclostridium sufflavum]PYG85884.1 stage V sporulation protein AD [Ruminiclostridium sufflavum DSM 19573]